LEVGVITKFCKSARVGLFSQKANGLAFGGICCFLTAWRSPLHFFYHALDAHQRISLDLNISLGGFASLDCKVLSLNRSAAALPPSGAIEDPVGIFRKAKLL
jgi:hypothetical protein